MGNCLVLKERPIKIMKRDGEILQYRAPMKVHKLLTEYNGHTISKTMPAIQHLQPRDDLLPGQLYHLLPLPVPSLKFEEKNLLHSNPKVAAGCISSGVLRIKLVISKQELEMMLRKGGVSVNDMVSQLQNKQTIKAVDMLDSNGHENCKGWKPMLQSIPEEM